MIGRRASRRWLWSAVGALCFLLGLIGLAVPLMPTTVFWIAAVWCWLKSTPWRGRRLLRHPRYGAPIRQFLRHGCVPRRAKALALGAMAANFALAALLLRPGMAALTATALVLLAVGVWLATRPEMPPL